MRSRIGLIGGLVAGVLALALGAAPAAAWQPEPATYGVGSATNLAVRMHDGTVLRADVYFPTDPKTGKEAVGRFPVILTQTPYGKEAAQFAGGNLAGLAGQSNYLVQRGYIDVIADVRGTGGSQGEWGLFDPIQGTDGATLVNWAAALPHADGDVGLLGASYLGIDQFATAVDAGPAHVKAMFPIISANDIYRDTAFAGGFPDIEFDSFYLGLTATLNLIGPAAENNNDLFTALTGHVHDLADYDAATVASVETGGDEAYDQAYWGARNPVNDLQRLVDDGIPAFLIGGWYDLFQRGELLNYSGFQNAWDHRPVLAPMAPSQAVTSRYQLLQGPWYHVTTGMGLNYHGLDLNGLELAWFDRWLKGVDTGITETQTPLHLEDLATGRYQDVARYPLEQATPTRYYLHPGGGLSTQAPPARSATDTLLFTGTEIPCTTSAEQWAAGAGALALSFFGLQDPCTQNSAPSQFGPGTKSYTTAPFTKPTVLAGPIGATLYASANTTDTEWVVQLADVAPDGAAKPLTSGLLDGSQRALDTTLTWYAGDGQPLLPYHPYTKAAQTPVQPGRVTRYDIEVFPTFDTLAPGHRLRVTIATSDFPHALPTVGQAVGLLGGVYQLQHSAAYPSSLELPLVTNVASVTSPSGASSPALGCPAPGRLTRNRLGPVRLGMRRSQVRRLRVSCLGIRVGYQRGRAALLLTTNHRYTLRGVRAGAHAGAVVKRLRLKRGLRLRRVTWYTVRLGGRRGVLEVRHGRVVRIGIAARRLTAIRPLLRALA